MLQSLATHKEFKIGAIEKKLFPPDFETWIKKTPTIGNYTKKDANSDCLLSLSLSLVKT